MPVTDLLVRTNASFAFRLASDEKLSYGV